MSLEDTSAQTWVQSRDCPEIDIRQAKFLDANDRMAKPHIVDHTRRKFPRRVFLFRSSKQWNEAMWIVHMFVLLFSVLEDHIKHYMIVYSLSPHLCYVHRRGDHNPHVMEVPNKRMRVRGVCRC